MTTQKWDDFEVYNLLCQIDGGYQPTVNEELMLNDRKELILHGYAINALPKSIKHLKALEVLDLSSTQVETLPMGLHHFTQLQSLKLCYSQIKVLPDSVYRIKNLKTLNIYNTPITTLPDNLFQLKHLEQLFIGGHRLREIPKAIGSLRSLKQLHIANCFCRTLPESISQLRSLQVLSINESSIDALPDTIGQLINLQELYICYSNISYIPKAITELSSLRILDISHNNISCLPEGFEKLSNLNVLIINDTNISEIPYSMAIGPLPIFNEYPNYTPCNKPGIYAEESGLPSFYFEGKEVVARYLSVERKQGFRESKIIFLGFGNSGKTYTVNRFRENGRKALSGEDFGGDETHGIRIVDYQYSINNKIYTFHLWDFGGQEMNHAMHRCFLTENAVYVLMVSSRSEQQTEKLRYWLNSILPYLSIQERANSTNYEKPIITILENRYNNIGTSDVDQIELKYEFKNELTLKFIQISVKDADQDDFQEQVMKPLIDLALSAEQRMPHPPISYIRIKDAIKEELDKHGYIDKKQYGNICQRNGIRSITEQSEILPHFKHLGICFYSSATSKDEASYYFRLFRPLWITNALSVIINECDAIQGELPISQIHKALKNPVPCIFAPAYYRMDPTATYSEEDCDYILQVAAEESLLFYVTGRETVFIPAMCRRRDKPREFGKPEHPAYNIEYEVTYRHLPETVVQHLMLDCRRNHFDLVTCWRGGFLAEGESCTAVVDTRLGGKSLYFDIWSSSGEYPIKSFFLKLRDMLGIGRSVPPSINEYIIKGGERYSVRRLINSDKNGIKYVATDRNPTITHSVAELLGAFPNKGLDSYRKDLYRFEVDLRWERFAANFPNTTQMFEQLCKRLFRLEYFSPNTVFQSVPNNPGVEVHPAVAEHNMLAGKRISFQAKFFTGEINYSQIKESVKNTIKYYSKKREPQDAINAVVLYCNKTISQSDACLVFPANKQFAEIVQLMKAASIELVVIASDELLNQIQKYPELIDSYFYV